VGPGDAHEQSSEPEEQDRKRKMPSPTGRAVDHVRQKRVARETVREACPPSLREHVEGGQRRDRQQAEER
jgi:hypothetical protein